MEWRVRPFREADFPAIWELERVRDAEGYASAVTIRQAAALWPATFLVADEDDGAVGFTIGAASSDPGVGWILRLKVREDRQRQGCATALLLAVLERLRAGECARSGSRSHLGIGRPGRSMLGSAFSRRRCSPGTSGRARIAWSIALRP